MITRNQAKSNDDTNPKSHLQQTTNDSEEKTATSTKTNIDDKPSELIEYSEREPDKKPLFSTKTFIDNTSDTIDKNEPIDVNGKSSLLDLLRRHIESFDGYGNARQWFINVNLKFSQFNLNFGDRLEIIPYFLEGDAFIWFSVNQDKFQSYTHLCKLFAYEYFKLEQSSYPGVNAEQTNKSLSSHSPIVTNENQADTSVALQNGHLNNAVLSNTIAKALVDKFVKDPLKFSGGKDNVITWIDEIEQQFNVMHLSNTDKLNLIHICLKGEALHWFKQHKQKFTSWSTFIDEITKSFQSNLKQDVAFQKLKQYHQTVHQSVIQYYMEMTKLMKQADPDMNESTKIHYLVNGLRPSLSTETRRNYPKNSEEFLTNAKVAEELTALNTSFTSSSIIGDEQPSSTSDSNTNDFNDYRRNADVNNYCDNDNTNYSYDDNPNRFVNQISKSSSFKLSRGNLSSRSFRSTPIGKATSNSSRPSLNDNTRRDDNYNQQKPRQQFHQPSQRCFKCGSPGHIARYCHHFDNRGQ
jgi:hypothetical protein